MKMPECPATPKPSPDSSSLQTDSELTATVFEKCIANIQHLLIARLGELEERREAINDRYPFDDLIFQWDLVDTEERMIQELMQYLVNKQNRRN